MLEKIAQFNRTKKDLEQAIYVDLWPNWVKMIFNPVILCYIE